MKGKKSFILYADQKAIFNELSNEQAGKLIKYIYSYVNDENPYIDDQIIKVCFAPIKLQLKRDLEKWEQKQIQRSEAGKRSAEVRKQNSTSVNEREQTSTVNDNDNVNVNDIYINDKKYITKTVEDSEDVVSLTKEIADYFNVSEVSNHRNYVLIGNFVRKNFNDSNLENLKKQFYGYRDTSLKNNFKHSLKNYIGSPNERYEDGAWCEKDWSESTSQKQPSNVLPKRVSRINPS